MPNPNESSQILQKLRPDTRAVVARRCAGMLLLLNSGIAASTMGACSTITERLQFGPAFLAEGPQRMDGVPVHQFAKVGKGLVGCEIRVDDHMSDRLRLFDHAAARYDTHPADQRVTLTSAESSASSWTSASA